ncbi:ERCC4 domain-containing protein [Ruania alba]|uniref:ERCC4 domain-containing protein n=1 Tax=Ruania alba TaxID=648782 RepID=UPI000B0AF2A2|nr:ERCC4 domain-containing protein [Ruania alba]
MAAGDYAVELDGTVIASVERKSLPDLVSTLTTGKMRYLAADLSDLPRAAIVVEDRYSQVFALEHVRPSVVAEAVAEHHARFPQVAIMFCETRALAQEWTYRFLAAALAEVAGENIGAEQASWAMLWPVSG